MKSLVIVVSVHHGNTLRVAQAIGEVLGCTVCEPETVAPEDVLACDLVGFGSGIYFGRFHRRLVHFVRSFPSIEGKRAFVFSTSGFGRKEYNRSFERMLTEKGFTVMGSFACRGYDTFGLLWILGGINKGKPAEEELEDARRFARSLRMA